MSSLIRGFTPLDMYDAPRSQLVQTLFDSINYVSKFVPIIPIRFNRRYNLKSISLHDNVIKAHFST
jgi:hypothetical protein